MENILTAEKLKKFTNILIIGHAQHGKDTAAEYLSKFSNNELNFMSSSVVVGRQAVYEKLKNKYGYKNFDECFKDRVNHRSEWYNLICEYNKNDKTLLTRTILSNSRIYVGMRDLKEFEASQELFTRIFWVDAEARTNTFEPTDSFNILKTSSNRIEIIDNNGTLADLMKRCERLANEIKLEKTDVEIKTPLPKNDEEGCVTID